MIHDISSPDSPSRAGHMLHQLQGGQGIHSNSVLRKEEPKLLGWPKFPWNFSILPKTQVSSLANPIFAHSTLFLFLDGLSTPCESKLFPDQTNPFPLAPGSSSLFSSSFKVSHLIFTSISIFDPLPVLLLTFHPRHLSQSNCLGVPIHPGHPLPDRKLGATGNTFPATQPRSVERKIKDIVLVCFQEKAIQAPPEAVSLGLNYYSHP